MSSLEDALRGVLRPMITEAVEEAVAKALARQVRLKAEVMSAVQASRLAKRRRSVTVAAMKSGALAADKEGRNWRTTAAAVQEWVAKGCPE